MLRPPALKAICSIFASDDRYADDVHYFGGMLKQLDLVDYPLYMEALNALPPVPTDRGRGMARRVGAAARGIAPVARRVARAPDVRRLLEARFAPRGLRGDHGADDARHRLGRRLHEHLAARDGGARVSETPARRPVEPRRCRDRPARAEHRPRRGARALVGPLAEGRRQRHRPRAADRRVRAASDARRHGTSPSTAADGASRPAGRPNGATTCGSSSRMRAPNDPGTGRTCSRSAATSDGPPGSPAPPRHPGASRWISGPTRRSRSVYDWAAPPDELEILGHPVVHARVMSSAPVASLSAKLCDVHPDGTSQLVTRGLLNLTHRDSRESPAALEPGRAYDVTLELEVTSWVFEPGHRIRLDLAGTDWPNCWPPPTPVTLTIDRSRSSLVLPGVGSPAPIEEVPELPRPRRSQAWETDGVTSTVEHDLDRRETRALLRFGGATDADDVAPAIDQRYEGTVGVSIDDPGRAWVEAATTYTITLARSDGLGRSAHPHRERRGGVSRPARCRRETGRRAEMVAQHRTADPSEPAVRSG